MITHSILVIAAATLQGSGTGLDAEYRSLTDNISEVVNLFPEPSTGLFVDEWISPGGTERALWAVNPYASTLLRFEGSTLDGLPAQPASSPPAPIAPSLIVPTGLNPVAVAVWESPGGERQVLAVCAGTHALFVHDAENGDLLNMVRLESAQDVGGCGTMLSEGADLVVDAENDQVYVSCPTSNTVLRIDLADTDQVQTFHFPVGQRPGPLVLDPGEVGAADNSVIVAMTITGNNTVFVEEGVPGAPSGFSGRVYDLAALGQALEDSDVYRIGDPQGIGSVSSIVRGSGSLHFDVELGPGGELWILSSDSKNADVDLFGENPATEPGHRGRFVVNQLCRVDQSCPAPCTSFASHDLDDPANGSVSPPVYSDSTSINQARVVEFLSDAFPADALVASPFRDVLLPLLSNGSRIPGPLPALPDGAQCYDVALFESNPDRILALCLGTMTIEVLNTDFETVARLDLGHDPTPAQIRRGRDVFLDGSLSLHSRMSCASCHPGGGTDQLGWSLQDGVVDFKNVMLTQSLLSIEDTFPHHWRGERSLKDFQGTFEGLLGAPEGPCDDQMADFIAFVQSLQAPANPIQDPRRVLNDGQMNRFDDDVLTVLYDGDPVIGQNLYFDVTNFAGRTCAQCHALPTGSDGNFTPEVLSYIPRETNIEVPHLRQLQNRGHRSTDVFLGGPNDPVAVNLEGFGVRHSGGGTPQVGPGATLFDFVTETDGFQVPDMLEIEELSSIVRFVDQFDQGIAPAAHWAEFLPPEFNQCFSGAMPFTERDALFAGIEEILIQGAEGGWTEGAKGWNEVVFFGQILVPGQGGWSSMRGYYEDDPEIAKAGPNADEPGFIILANGGRGRWTWPEFKAVLSSDVYPRLTFMGVPLGNGRRLGADFDNDNLYNNLSGEDPWTPLAFPFPLEPEVVTDELDFVTARLAKYHVKFNRPVIYRVEYGIKDPADSSGSTMLPDYTYSYFSVPGAFDPDNGEPNGLEEWSDFVDEDTIVLTHDHPSHPLSETDLPLTQMEFLVTLHAWDRDGQAISKDLDPFTPSAGGDFENFEMVHVESITGTDDGQGRFTVTIDLARDETLATVSGGIPSVADPAYEPAEGFAVLLTVAVENVVPGSQQEPTFLPVESGPGGGASFDAVTGGTTSFSVTDILGLPGSVPYDAIEHYILTDATDSNGRAVVSFDTAGVGNLDVKVTVQGTLRDQNGDQIYESTDLGTLQLLEGEASAEWRRYAPPDTSCP